jgi:hypothetical protein
MSYYNARVPIETLVGQTFARVTGSAGDDEVCFYRNADDTKPAYKMLHEQDCCEGVSLHDLDNDLSVLEGTPILSAEESTNSDQDKPSEYADSWTWTFYRFQTAKGGLVMRWLGESNGYYSEGVDLIDTAKVGD